MTINQQTAGVATLALLLLMAGSSTAATTYDEDSTEVHVKRVHKVVVDCDENSGQDCEQEIHIESVGDHQMVWVEGGEHGAHHYSFGTDFAGKGGFLGVQLTDLTPELRTHFGVVGDEGIMVARVIDDSPAFRAGLAAGDIITRVDGVSMGSSADLTHAIRAHEEGETVNLEIWRGGSSETLSATLDKSPQSAHIRRHVMIDCEDDEENCGAHFVSSATHGMNVECPEDEECDVRVDCSDGDCDCTLNGESIDCQELHKKHDQDD